MGTSLTLLNLMRWRGNAWMRGGSETGSRRRHCQRRRSGLLPVAAPSTTSYSLVKWAVSQNRASTGHAAAPLVYIEPSPTTRFGSWREKKECGHHRHCRCRCRCPRATSAAAPTSADASFLRRSGER